MFVPAWDESAVIAPMLRTALTNIDYGNYRIFVGHYRNDPLTGAAIASVADPRIEPVLVDADGPTTKADCLNHLYDALVAHEIETGRSVAAVVMHDAEDVIHPLELTLFNRLLDKAALIQLPVLPLPDRGSPWIAGHYCDEFAEAHAKEMVVREAVGAAIPLAGVGCSMARDALARIAALNEGHPFAGGSLTEDYELGLRVGELGLKTIFVRMPAVPGSRSVVASRGHFPTTFGEAVRQKARWLGGIALNGWDRLGWTGGWGERWMRMRDRRGPIAAMLLLSGYSAALAVVADVARPGARRADPGRRRPAARRPAVGQFVAASVAGRDAHPVHRLGLWLGPGHAVRPADGGRQFDRHLRGVARAVALPRPGAIGVGQDPPHLSGRASRMSAPLRFLSVAVLAWAAVRATTLGALPGFTVSHAKPVRRRRSSPPS